MDLCEQFKETLQEQDDNSRQILMFSVSRKLSRIFPFPSVTKYIDIFTDRQSII
ncbi:unnamed protein product [Paramecium pentaurelia]|uniref:Uncharacterized protein n=1 Tax=Paramecium pentaurelia TaxID=43138 RepID=A0A8S1S310_9CILI|nr:unnamed protein product [Paramecium pentaurelia]